MVLLISGIAAFLVTGAVFWILMPRGGKVHRFANTEFEPYISVALCAGVALGSTMMLSGVINMMATQ
jgi:hypothetical protein